MTKHFAILASLVTLTTACTAPIINDAVSKFQSGTANSFSILQSDASSVVATQRYRAFTGDVIGKRIAQASRTYNQNFHDYVCLQSVQFAGLLDSATVLKGIQLPPKQADATANNAQASANLKAKVDKCAGEVDAYLNMVPAGLPLTTSDFLPDNAGAGALPLVVIIPAIALAANLIADVVGGITTISQGVSAEVQAGKIKEAVLKPETQEKVIATLRSLSTPDARLAGWCANNQPICSNLKNDPGAAGGSTPGGKQYSIPLDLTDFSNICSKLTDQPSSTDPGSPPKLSYAVISNATIVRRWLAIRLAYSTYVDYMNYSATTDPTSFTAKFDTRRQALDAAISAYQAIPGSEDIVSQETQAWANLTAASCGKLSLDQLYTAMSTFANYTGSVLTGVGKGSDAVNTYNKAVPAANNL